MAETLNDILFPEDRQIWKARDEDELANEIRYNIKKWVKKDLLEMPITPQTTWLFNRWMERFNLKLEDIK